MNKAKDLLIERKTAETQGRGGRKRAGGKEEGREEGKEETYMPGT